MRHLVVNKLLASGREDALLAALRRGQEQALRRCLKPGSPLASIGGLTLTQASAPVVGWRDIGRKGKGGMQGEE